MANVNSRQRSNDSFTFDVMEHLLVFGEKKDSGWTKEANIVSWNGGSPKLDIREWDPEHERMSKGITLYEAEAEKLAKVLCKRYGLAAADTVKKGSVKRETVKDDLAADDPVSGDLPADDPVTGEAEEGGTS